MTNVEVVRLIGLTHLFQPPLTAYLASSGGLDLNRAFACTTGLATAVLHNMAFAAVALPTALGVLLAFEADELPESGMTRNLALLLATFWSWRLYRQLTTLRRYWPAEPRHLRRLQHALSCIFLLQGPILAFFTCAASADKTAISYHGAPRATDTP